MGDIYKSQEEFEYRDRSTERAMRFYAERHRDDWNRMTADIERLTKERDEARQILLDRIGEDDEAVAYFKKRLGME